LPSSLSFYLISASKLKSTISGSTTPLSFVLVIKSSVNNEDFVSVPSVRPKAEKDLVKDFFFLCFNFS
jgi:hypothetical protein